MSAPVLFSRIARSVSIFTFAAVASALVLAQAAVGVATLLWQVPLGLGLAHQGLAMVVLAMAVVHWRLCAGVPAQR
jgi:cytochrome c oxidase assembly protein subunit 15